ncbi:alpha/beta fold hydrolase [Cesiribacter andamanensis]|uniref:2-hydroxy-6-oxo-6-phenylhexa-2,4-dienoate hydrolase n=1 Tax=Cesiribacter andamanensis AMV16 TaxID=1279009 RepID=M7N5S0_9BACT|nr:alpha/beta hydrolase [Cesiribacter andamanensis]EMR02581.1 2-hydroxy-6-oxo-6-phenylhexa-2,4-dienoate hydrolase [Cesiribacter andamanensis AMV16]
MDPIAAYKHSRQKLFDAAGIQPESRTINTNGPIRQVHYLKAGQGPPLLLLHGGGGHASEWIPLLKPLAQHFEVYAPDRPGCGLSDFFNYRGVDVQAHAVAFLQSFLDAAGLQRAVVAGHSMGGYFSVCFALRHPERVQQLLLLGAPAGINRWIPYLLRLLGTRGLNRLLLHTLARPSKQNAAFIHKQLLVAHPEQLSDAYLEHAYYSLLLPGSRKSFNTLLENVLSVGGWKKRLLVTGQLSSLQLPVGFLWGDRDAFERPATGRAKAGTIPRHTFDVVAQAGHALWLDQPEKTSQLLLARLGVN